MGLGENVAQDVVIKAINNKVTIQFVSKVFMTNRHF